MGKTVSQLSPDGGTNKYDLRDSNIAPIELDSAHASRPYAVNEEFVFDADGNLYTATSPISQGSAIVVYPTSGYNCKLSDSVTGQIKAVKDSLGTASTKNAISVVTDSSDLVESGAVKDIVGWGNKNLLKGLATASARGVTATPQSNGSILITGTMSGVTYVILSILLDKPLDLPNGEYVFSVGTAIDNVRYEVYGYDSDFEKIGETAFGETTCNVTISKSYQYFRINLLITDNAVYDNKTIYPMISKGGGEYEPYHESVADSLDDKMGYADNGALGAKNIDGTKYKTVTQDGIVWVVNNDNTITISGTNSSTGSNQNPNNPANMFIAPFSAQVILTGGISPQCNLYPWVLDDNARPWKDSSKTERVTGNVESPIQEMSFWMEKGKTYSVTLRVVGSYQIPGQLTFKPMIRLATDTDPTYQPYAQTNRELTVNKADNSVIAPVENNPTASQAYAVNDVFIRNGALCKVTSAISQGDTLSNQFTVTNVGAILTALLNA